MLIFSDFLSSRVNGIYSVTKQDIQRRLLGFRETLTFLLMLCQLTDQTTDQLIEGIIDNKNNQ